MAENIRAANELEAAKAHTGELEAQLKAVKTERDDICAKFGQTEAELEETLAKLSSFEAEKKAFEFALESAKSEIESLKANYEESKKTTAEFKSQFESSAKTIACLNTEIYSKEESISGLTKQVSELEDQLTTARAESSSALESTRSELESVKKRFAEHLVQNAGTKSRKEELEVESLRLNAELATLKAAVFGGVKVTSSGKKQPAKAAPVHASEPTQVPAKSETPLSR